MEKKGIGGKRGEKKKKEEYSGGACGAALPVLHSIVHVGGSIGNAYFTWISAAARDCLPSQRAGERKGGRRRKKKKRKKKRRRPFMS